MLITFITKIKISITEKNHNNSTSYNRSNEYTNIENNYYWMENILKIN